MARTSLGYLLALLLALAPVALPAAAHDQPEKRTISLSASGIVKTTPDMVEIAAGVTSEAPVGARRVRPEHRSHGQGGRDA